MIRRALSTFVSVLLLSSCAQFDDSKIWDKITEHEQRIEKLEAACDLMNTNISALQAIVTALQGNDFVTGVAEIVEDGEVVGYTITFSKSGLVKIYQGSDGADGADGALGADGRPGADGAPGQDGADGKDGHSPVVGVRKGVDGIYYWTIDGEWMLDDEGQKVPATGRDGADAEEGAGGKDGVTPLLKIEDGYWFVSYDGGASWAKLYKAVGENGADGATGTPGQDGADGKDGQSFFQNVDTTSSEDYIILTLADGTLIKLPTWKAFEELQTMVNKLNTNLSALQTIVEALQNNDYVTDIQPIIDNGIEIGYTILFAKSPSITIFHGKDGADGSDGADGAAGAPGQDGEAGKDGYTPVLGVKPADDDWSLDSGWNGDSSSQTKYYWTLDGEWLLDENGNRIPASGTNGTDGSNGSNGQNGITPKLKITDGYWYVSLDGGQTWQPEPLGPATAGAGGSIFTDVSYTTAYLYITLADGEVIKFSRDNDGISDYCIIDQIIIDGRDVSFMGHINVEKEDIQYCKVSIYYSDTESFNTHTAKEVSTTSYDYKNYFTISLPRLDFGVTYKYCICLDVKSQVHYSPVYEFTTDEGGNGNFIEFLFNDNIENGVNLSTVGTIKDGRLRVTSANPIDYTGISFDNDKDWSFECIALPSTATGLITIGGGSTTGGFIQLPNPLGSPTACLRFRDINKTMSVEASWTTGYTKPTHFAVTYSASEKVFKMYMDYIELPVAFSVGNAETFKSFTSGKLFGGYTDRYDFVGDIYYMKFTQNEVLSVNDFHRE